MGHSDSKDYTHTKPMGFKLAGETHTGDVWLKDWNHLLLVFFGSALSARQGILQVVAGTQDTSRESGSRT